MMGKNVYHSEWMSEKRRILTYLPYSFFYMAWIDGVPWIRKTAGVSMSRRLSPDGTPTLTRLSVPRTAAIGVIVGRLVMVIPPNNRAIRQVRSVLQETAMWLIPALPK